MRNVYLNKFESPTSKIHNGQWFDQHMNAVHCPRLCSEHALKELFSGWLRYADEHKQRYESGIGDDMILGEHWANLGVALRGLLNGETGRFDCGTLDSLLSDVLGAEGFDFNRI